MGPTEYREAIAKLGLSQRRAAEALGIGERQGRVYAHTGVPARVEARVRMQLRQLAEQHE